jgi:hypothetical protein
MQRRNSRHSSIVVDIMSAKLRCARYAAIVVLAAACWPAAGGGRALGQTLPQPPAAQNETAPPAPPRETVPQPRDVVPQAKEPGAASGTLSEQLSRSGGVIQPPPHADRKMEAPTPDPGAQSTPVVPPPGSPGGDPNVKPK